jgi:hypothetical protein
MLRLGAAAFGSGAIQWKTPAGAGITEIEGTTTALTLYAAQEVRIVPNTGVAIAVFSNAARAARDTGVFLWVEGRGSRQVWVDNNNFLKVDV